MMRGANTGKLGALSVAIILHGALALALVAKEEVQVEGADGGAQVRLGNVFADMAAGRLTAERPDETESPPTDFPERNEAERAEAVEHADIVSPITPVDTAPMPHASTEEPAVLSPASGKVVQAEQPEVLEAAPARERLEGFAPTRSTVARAPRPKPRSVTFEMARKPAPAAKPDPEPAATPARPAAPQPGNAERNARAGEATGKPDAAARQSGDGGRQQAAGNAAISNYPGLVMRKLSRAGKPRVNARGTAVVAFRISANGGLATVSLARKSGSSALDQAAVRLVRGAAPFPKPPQGARRSFSIQIKGR